MRLEVDWTPAITLSDAQVKYLRYGGVQFTTKNASALSGAVITNPEIIGQFQACYSTVLGRVPITAVKEILTKSAEKIAEEFNNPRPHLMMNKPEEIEIEL